MKKIILLFIYIAIASSLYGQAQRRDTVVLSVYNSNQRFMLYPMPFGKDKPDVDFTAKMVLALDTIQVMETATRKDSTGKYPKRMVTQRQCCKLPKDSLTGKVALLYMNPDCDVSTQVYNAQKSGAIAVILIHSTNNRDSVELPKQGANQVRYDDASKIRIPCFTVRKGIGDKLTMMLPSLVGIQRPRANVDPQSSVVSNNPPVATTTAKTKDKITDADATIETDLFNNTSFGKEGFSISPNPTRNQANVTYQFTNPTDVTIEAKTASGQVIFSRILRGATVGNVEIPTVDYPNGTYFVTLQYGKEVKTKKLVVRH